MNVELDTERFHLRELCAADATDRYLGWFKDSGAAKYIAAAATTRDLSGLREYITERAGRDEVLFLGIFDRLTGLHIGNIKFEPIDVRQGYAIMGILVGDPLYRGKGVAPEVLQATSIWLKENRQILQIVLGVRSDNTRAIRAYEMAGFIVENTPHIAGPHDGCVTMVLHL